MLTEQMVEGTANKIDSTIFIGTGDPMSGVFLSAGSSEVFDSGSTAFSELLESNVRNVIPKVVPRVRGNAKWYIATSVLWQYFRGLRTTTGEYLFNEASQGQAAPSTLWGYPVVEINDNNAPSTSAAATGFAVFGDLTGVYVGERLVDFTLFIDPYTKSQNYQTAFRFASRWAFAQALNTKYSRIVTAAS
jgi:HK97 family phage major capsid protein